MSRPIKAGIDYFPLDVNMDEKVELIEAKYGIAGFGVLIRLYQSIYKHGYFLEIDEEKLLLLKNRLHVEPDFLNDFINDSLRWKIFDSHLYEKYKILTSKGIQNRYIEATKRRKDILFIQEFLLISDVFKSYGNRVNVNINSINACINPENENIKKQSKVNKSKVNKNIKDIAPQIKKFADEFIEDVFRQEGNKAPKITPALKTKSYAAIDALVRIDGFTLEYIEQVVGWGVKDPFWKPNLLSLGSLRRVSVNNGLTKFQNVASAFEKNKNGGKNYAANKPAFTGNDTRQSEWECPTPGWAKDLE